MISDRKLEDMDYLTNVFDLVGLPAAIPPEIVSPMKPDMLKPLKVLLEEKNTTDEHPVFWSAIKNDANDVKRVCLLVFSEGGEAVVLVNALYNDVCRDGLLVTCRDLPTTFAMRKIATML